MDNYFYLLINPEKLLWVDVNFTVQNNNIVSEVIIIS